MWEFLSVVHICICTEDTACHDLPDMRHEKLLPIVTDAQMVKYLLLLDILSEVTQ